MTLASYSIQKCVRKTLAHATRSMGFAAAVLAILGTALQANAKNPKTFKRISHIYAFENTDIETETVCEIITATPDGRTLIYSDAKMTFAWGWADLEQGESGFVPYWDDLILAPDLPSNLKCD